MTARTNRIEGWTVIVSERLWKEHPHQTDEALKLLQVQLQEIGKRVPAPAVERLREVKLWFSPEYQGVRPTAEYHPNGSWLREHGRNPDMAKGVEFTNIGIFHEEMVRMPAFVLHELAHSYHDRVLPDAFENKEIKSSYERAKASGKYDRVERWYGNGRTNTFERAYAMTNPQEYFAESTEAFFWRNDFYPFTRVELREQDPEMERLLARLWGVKE
jgi:hypothetical protein